MNIKRLTEFGLSLVLSLSSLLVIAVPTAHAATVAWDGEGVDNNFSTAVNWVGDVVPSNGDLLQFPTSVDSDTVNGDDRILNNDIASLSVAGIQVTGTYATGDYDMYKITGNAITLTGNMSGSQAGQGDFIQIEVALTVGANITLQQVNSSSSLAIGAYNVTLDGSYFQGALTGSGAITVALTDSGAGGAGGGCSPTTLPSPITGSASGYSGAVTVQGGGFLRVTKSTTDLGQVASSITKASDGTVAIVADNGFDVTLATPMTFNGGSATATQLENADCVNTAKKTITLSGNMTFTADTTFYVGNVDLKFTGTLTGKQFVKIQYNSTGTIIFPDNSVLTPTTKTTDYTANSPGTSIYVNSNEVAVVTGTYGVTTVSNGGTLKGTGTIGSLFVAAGGKLAPGLSPGCINSGNLTLAGTFEVELGGTTECTEYDQTNVTGTVDVTNGTLSVLRFNDFKPVAGQTYTIIKNDVSDAVTGTFTNLAEGATFTADGYVYSVSYIGGDGNDVVLTVVSVPAVPNTGFKMLTNNPTITMISSLLAAGAIFGISKRYNRLSSKRK